MTRTIAAVTMAAVVMPPYLSFRVEDSTGLVARPRRDHQPTVPLKTEITSRTGCTAQRSSSLRATAQAAMECDTDLARRVGDLQVHPDVDDVIAVSQDELTQILSDILRIVFSHSNVRHVDIYAGRQPARDRVTVIAAYDLSSPLPCIRMLGRSDNECHRLQMEQWPPSCSATWFDNGFDYIYQIAIDKKPIGTT